MFTYKSPDLGGATVTVAYLNASDAGSDVSYTEAISDIYYFSLNICPRAN